MSRPPLQLAYLRAIYAITLPDRTIELTFAGRRFANAGPAPALAARWCFLTARNPMSERLDELTNRRRDEALEGAVKATSLRWLPASGRAPEGGWHEPGRILLGCSRDQALGLARSFGQRAIVWCELDRVGILDCRTEAWTRRPAFWS
jgi:hypothetical protein